MITRNDIIEALKLLSAYSADKTPNPDPAVVLAHLDYTKRHPTWTGDDWVAAAADLNQRPRERMVQPADLGEIIKSWKQDELARMTPEERESAWDDIGGSVSVNGVRIDRHGYPDKSDPDEPDYPAEWSTDERLRAYWQRVRADQDKPSGLGVRIEEPPFRPAGYGDAPDEHLPEGECADPSCDQPSTFGPYCAKHFCLNNALGAGIGR